MTNDIFYFVLVIAISQHILVEKFITIETEIPIVCMVKCVSRNCECHFGGDTPKSERAKKISQKIYSALNYEHMKSVRT